MFLLSSKTKFIKQVEDCLWTLELISKYNKVSLLWKLGHASYQGNEIADKLAKVGPENHLNLAAALQGESRDTSEEG